jgi:hypothetical protein
MNALGQKPVFRSLEDSAVIGTLVTKTEQTDIAKEKRTSEKAKLQVLCKVRVDSPTNSHKLHIIGGFAVSSTAMIPKNPLRRIVSRTPLFFELYNDGTEKFCATLDTLDCGHQQISYLLVDDGKKWHRCPECRSILEQSLTSLPRKKPAASVPAPKDRKKAA